jgi:tetratricopeptide (TPR) repeat protein
LGKAAEAEDRANALRKAMRDAAQNYLEVAADYARSGLREDAADVLSRFAAANQSDVDPMVYYDLAFYSHKLGREEQARRYLEKARLAPPGFCFPFRLESIEVLRWAEAENPRDPRAPYYLGNLLFDRQPVSAIKEWEKSSGRDGALATLWRNLGIGYSRVNKDIPRAVACLERAVALSPDDARLYAELDELYDLAGEPAEKRLALLSKHHETVSRRDDSLSREIGLLIELGRYGRALELLASHHFHVWEGGGGVHDMFVDAHLLRGQVLLRRGRPARALDDFRAALAYPENLEVARPDAGGRDAEIDYWIGTALEAASDRSKAEEMFERSANCAAPPGELLYYQGLSCRKLGRVGESEAAFDRLVAWGRAGLEGQPAMDYFAKFGERESAERRQAEFRYVLGLGLLGRGRQAEARREFERALALYPRWARARRQLDRLIREQIS